MSNGSSPRPFSVTQDEFASNFDKIFRKPSPQQLDDARAEDEAFDQIATQSIQPTQEVDSK